MVFEDMAVNWTYAATAIAAAAIAAVWVDCKSWKDFGTGGTPPTLLGYIKIRRFGFIMSTFKRRNPFDYTTLSDDGPSYLNPSTIPPRQGPRPTLTRWCLPQRHRPLPITPPAHLTLHNLMSSFAISAPYNTYLRTASSILEGGTGSAIYVRPDACPDTLNPLAHKAGYEVAHVHPNDNSLHVYLSDRDAKVVLEKGWGQMFAVSWMAPGGFVMVYAPRDEEEVEVVRGIARAGVCFAVGKELDGKE